MFLSTNTLTWLNIANITYNAGQLLLDTAMASLTGSYVVSTQLHRSEFDRFEKIAGCDMWVSSAAPANPVIANWAANQRLRKVNYTAPDGYELVAFGASWRSAGPLI